MATSVLLPGAGADSWYWHSVTPSLRASEPPSLRASGHEGVGVDFSYADDACGLPEYAAGGVDAIGTRTDLVLVAQSMSAFVAPMIATARAGDLIVLVAPMVPASGETPGNWWENTAQPDAARRFAIEEGRDPYKAFDPTEIFLHDLDPALATPNLRAALWNPPTPFGQPWPLERWPDVATRCVIGQRDPLFPLEFQRRVVRQRLGIAVDEIDSGHLVALSRPTEVARLLLDYVDTDR